LHCANIGLGLIYAWPLIMCMCTVCTTYCCYNCVLCAQLQVVELDAASLQLCEQFCSDFPMSDYTALVRTKLAPNGLQLATTTSTAGAAKTSQLHAHTAAATASGNFNKSQYNNGSSGTRDVRALLKGYAGGSRILCSKDSFVQGAKELLTGLVPQEVLTIVRAHQVTRKCIYFVVHIYTVNAQVHCMYTAMYIYALWFTYRAI
jgi:hypothetical protein